MISICIVNYFSAYLLRQCVESIEAASKPLLIEIIIVNNSSHDAEFTSLVPWLQGRSIPIVVIESPNGNIGFSAANNLAVKSANGQYILLLNPDIIVKTDLFEKLAAFISSGTPFSVLGANYRYPNGKPQQSYFKTSDHSVFFDAVPIYKLYRVVKAKLIGNKSSAAHPKTADDLPIEVAVIPGAFMFLATSTFQQVGGNRLGYHVGLFGEQRLLRFKKLSLNDWLFHS